MTDKERVLAMVGNRPDYTEWCNAYDAATEISGAMESLGYCVRGLEYSSYEGCLRHRYDNGRIRFCMEYRPDGIRFTIARHFHHFNTPAEVIRFFGTTPGDEAIMAEACRRLSLVTFKSTGIDDYEEVGVTRDGSKILFTHHEYLRSTAGAYNYTVTCSALLKDGMLSMDIKCGNLALVKYGEQLGSISGGSRHADVAIQVDNEYSAAQQVADIIHRSTYDFVDSLIHRI